MHPVEPRPADLAAQRAAAAEVRLRLAQLVAGLGTWDWDVHTGSLTWDAQMASLYGTTLDEFGGTLRDFERFVHPEDRAHLAAELEDVVANVGELDTEFRVIRADGEERVMFARGQALPDSEGRTRHVLGAALDVTDVRAAARSEAEYARRLSRLAAVSLELAGAASVDDLVRVVIEGLAVIGADGGSVCVRDGDVIRLSMTESLGQQVQVEYGVLPLDGPLPGSRVALTGETVLLPDRATGLAYTSAMQAVYDGTGREAWAVLPLQVDRRLLGSLVVSWQEPREFTPGDLELLTGFAAQCAQSLDRVQALEAEREAVEAVERLAESLQRSLLTRPQQPEHLQIAVRYLPASEQAQVGGDWYDAFRTAADPQGLMLVVGDVSGHDRDAAGAMGQVRNLLRGLAVDSGSGPGALLARLDAALALLELDVLATAVVARVEPSDTGGAVLRWSNAGHIPPLLRLPDGTVSVLATDPDLLLGLTTDAAREDAVVPLPDGSTVLLCTDGLVERRGEDLDTGTDRLARALAEVGHLPVEELCDALVARVLPEAGEDDVALLVLRAQPAPPAPEPPRRLVLAPEPAAAGAARRHVRAACAAAGTEAEVRDDAVLLTSELVTNAVLHGRSQVRVDVVATPSSVRVEVGDDNSRLPERASQDASALDGRGLAILDELADAWGAAPLDIGKVVWFDVSSGGAAVGS